MLVAISTTIANDHDAHVKRLKERLTNRAQNLLQQNATIEPRPLKFDGSGVAQLTAWAPKPASDAILVEDADNGGKYFVIRLELVRADAVLTLGGQKSCCQLEPTDYMLKLAC